MRICAVLVHAPWNDVRVSLLSGSVDSCARRRTRAKVLLLYGEEVVVHTSWGVVVTRPEDVRPAPVHTLTRGRSLAMLARREALAGLRQQTGRETAGCEQSTLQVCTAVLFHLGLSLPSSK